MRFKPLLIVWLPLTIVACGGDEPDHDHDHDHDDHEDDCDDGGAVDTFAVGLTRTSTDGLYNVTLVSADPAPLDVGFTDLVLAVTDAGDAPLPESATLRIKPFMPLHGHGTTPETFPGALDGDDWLIEGVDIMMPGLWELWVQVDSTAGSDEALFRFCVEG